MNQRGGDKYEVEVELEPSKGGYRIHYSAFSPQRKKKTRRTFIYNVSSSSEAKREVIDENLLRNVVKNILGEKTEQLVWRKKPSEIRMELTHFINRLTRSSKRGGLLKKYGFGDNSHIGVDRQGRGLREEKDEEEEGEESNNPNQDPPLPRKSIFAAEEESANTKVFLAPSFSGKTTLMVEELNKLTPKELDEYDKILLFTESVASAPLKKLDKKVREKMMIYDRFIPQLVKVLKKINTVTKNRYRFLLLLDDCINLKSGILIKMILTLRNANISTVISVQYSKLLAKSQRQSIHDYYMLNLHLEDFEYLMSGFLAPHFRDLFEREGMGTKEENNKLNYKKLAEKAMDRLKGKLLHFDQRHDQITVYQRPGGYQRATQSRERR